MKNKLNTILSAGLIALAITGNVVAAESYASAGTAPLNFAIAAGNGTIVADSLVYSSVSNSTITVYRPRGVAKAYAVASATTNLVLYTDSSNTVAGVTLGEATDYVLVRNATSGYQLSRVEHVYSADSSAATTTYALLTAVTAAAGDPVYFVDTADNVSIPVLTTLAGMNIGGLFAGFDGMPVYLNLPGVAGASSIAGLYHRQ